MAVMILANSIPFNNKLINCIIRNAKRIDSETYFIYINTLGSQYHREPSMR